MRPFYNGNSALTTNQVQPALSESVQVFEYPTTGLSWSDFSSYGSNLRVNVPVNTGTTIYLYGVEIEVVYDLHCNKVVYGTTVLVDLTADTVTAATLMQGYTAHDRSGALITGTASGGSGDSYRLDNIVPEQTVACTTLLQNNAYYGFIQNGTPVDNSEQYLVTFDGTEYICEGYVPEANCSGVGDIRVVNTNAAQYLITPFFIEYENASSDYYFVVRGSGTHTVKVDKLTFIDDGATFTTKTITQNGTYSASSDNADGYSSVTVNVSGGGGGTYQAKTNISPTTSSQTITPDSGYDALSSVQINAMPTGTAGTPSATKGTVSNHSVSVTPSVTNTTGYITGGTKTGTAVTVSASELVSGNKAITANGNNIDVAEYATVSVNVSGGGSKNVQVAQSTTRVANTAYTKTASLTCSVSGKYDVYWDCFRSTTSGTSGSQLYIGGSAYGSANTTFSSNIHAQNNHLTNVQINANQEVAVYVRSRATNYYAYCGQLTIIQTA